jgi:hypothetical protein
MVRMALAVAAGLILLGCQSSPPSNTTPAASQRTPAAATEPAAPKGGAPLFANLGSYKREVTTSSTQARRFFVQGMILTYGFNHEEAGRSFREAVRLDPTCAACWWGAAYVLGPNINLPMLPDAYPKAYEAVQKAASLAGGASPVEKALIDALVKRYGEAAVQDRSALDLAYANAMREVAEQFPDDADVLSLFAESLLDLSPWNYWLPDGKPKETTTEASHALEKQ